MGAHATSLSYMSMPVWRGFPAAFSCGRAARQESNTQLGEMSRSTSSAARRRPAPSVPTGRPPDCADGQRGLKAISVRARMNSPNSISAGPTAKQQQKHLQQSSANSPKPANRFLTCGVVLEWRMPPGLRGTTPGGEGMQGEGGVRFPCSPSSPNAGSTRH